MQTTKKAEVLLDACEAAFKASIERETPETRAALAEARTRFREAAGAFDRGAPGCASPITIRFVASASEAVRPPEPQPQNEIGRPNVTPARPIECSNSALDISRSRVICNHVVGAITRDSDHEATNH